MTGIELVVAGLVVGVLIGATGMGAGSLMAPLLISVFGISAVSAVGTDLCTRRAPSWLAAFATSSWAR